MIVESISNKAVTTKFGSKTVFSFKAGGEWYKLGFKKPTFKEGDDIEFVFTDTAYGKEVDVASVRVAGGSVPKSASPSPVSTPKVGFPIAPLDGQRSIIRQNCVTNARELYVGSKGGKAFDYDENAASTIISIARMFEAYAAGDLDLEVAKAKVAKVVKAVSEEEPPVF